ncbi:MAG: Gfo/Idh/MocA family oxidoreductase [Planctomycetota bacterium]|jgi:UDP-N-acetyl-2-amino-2-deoxyglucuronate dehydrogenase
MKKFALIGVGGYIAPRHICAIKETGNDLIAALDKNDSVGILDRYFMNTRFFTEFERFDRHLEKLRRNGAGVDIVSICSPNYLHDAHCRFAMRIGADAICEKPLVLNPWNVDALQELEAEHGKIINTILQLRLHPSIVALKDQVDRSADGHIHDIDLTYITSRGPWYQTSWKGDMSQSGGIANNIGIHFFDMLIWIFGGVRSNIVHKFDTTRAAGFLELEKARVRWYLSLEKEDLSSDVQQKGQATYRSIHIDGKELEFSRGFADLHTRSYEEILAGRGYGLSEVRPSIQLVAEIRNAVISEVKGEHHPYLDRKS